MSGTSPKKSGVKPETLVGICMNRSSRLVMGLLAILKAGGAYVPLDGNHPDARLRFLVEETGLQLVITERQWASRFPNVAHLIILDEADLFAGESTENLSVPARADGLAYVIFTSGSTGKPKGVCVPHRGVVRLVKGANYARLDDRVIMLGLAPVAFDASTFEIWGSLANGGQLVLVPASHPSLGEIKQIIRSWQVNTLFITTALFNVLVDEGTADLASLRQLLTGGEAASKLHLQRACEQLPACRIVNVYGPTENTTFSSFYEVTAQSLEASTATSVPIGAPVSNTQLYVLDAHRSLLPVGVPGELYVAGDGLAREYLHHPALTEEKFIRHSLGTAGSVRLYRTGDWVRRLPDGNLKFMGRIDGQIKVRGFRIEPGEIEHRLCQHSSVKEAFVTAWQASSPEKKLVAYLVLRPGSGLDALALRQFVQSELPGYMVPEAWITLPALPLNHNGKVDRAALPPPPTGPARTDESGLTPTEREIAAWWKELLNASAAKQDHFFAQGGNSLLAMQLLSRIRSRFGIPLSMQDLFEHPTLEQLGTRIDGAGFGAAAPSALRLRAGTWANRAMVPLSAAQQRLWVLHQLHDLGGTYNVPMVLHLTGLLHLEALVYSLETLVARHAVLRTTFGYGHGQPGQQIASTVPVTLPVFTAELARGSNTPETLTGLLEAEAWRPFDLAQDRPWRAQLLQLSQEAHVLVLVFHHMVVDGWSLRVLAGEISTLYTSRVKGLPAALPPLPVQYPDYVQWQADQNQSGAWQSQLGYWKQHLAGVPPLLQLNLSRPRPANLTFAGDVHAFPLPAATADQLSQLGQTCRATPFMTWLSVFAVWLHQYSSREDLVVGTPIAGRNQRELESLLGFFVNTLVLRLRLPSRFTFRQVVDTVVETATQAYAHADLPFDQLVAELNPKRDSSYAPLVQIVFDLQEESVNWWQLSGLNVGPVRIRERTAKFDLHLSICRGQHGWESRFAYNSALFEAGTVARAAAHFVQLARQVVQSPDLPLDQFNPPERTKGVPADTASQEQLAELPLTPAVRADAVEQDNALGGAARNAMLANLWKKILKVDSIGPDEDFFSLGGNSLLAIQLIAELQRQTGYSLPVASLFAHSTVQEFSRYLLQFDACRVWESLVAVKPEGTRKAFFLRTPGFRGSGFYLQIGRSPARPATRIRPAGAGPQWNGCPKGIT
jgi:amino acid adenylation domain-containing protein